MENETVFRIVARAVAFIAFLFALVQLLSLPNDIVGLVHHARLAREGAMQRIQPEEMYWVRDYALGTLCRCVSLLLSLWVAQAHIIAGPRLRAFYGLSC
jgi:hypothetical protein